MKYLIKLATSCYKDASIELPDKDKAKCLIWDNYHIKEPSPFEAIWNMKEQFWRSKYGIFFPDEVDYWAKI